MNYLLDTCVISELVKIEPDKQVAEWINSVEEGQLYLSVVTIGELEKGISKLKPSKRKDKITEWLHNDLIFRFNDRILNLDINTFIEWGRLNATLENQGKKMPSIDSLIAATAIQYNLCLVTRNDRDFQNCNIQILNPWK
ncbi:type II toxin-antitoxin system VapC family toxin [bacterium]|nr:type II toxin-antitoxin system VapC family toxin [bacterium]MBU1632953.1 type II toxin-antitoxin system VapC family toxin [bacterium]MBU1872573.1 type II toxin-antitoxin system VapC family toxin [bacterium]